MTKVLVIFLLLIVLQVNAQIVKTESLLLEKTPVQLQLSDYGEIRGKVVYLNLHENETTSVLAAKDYLATRNGHLIVVKQKGNRNLSFTQKGMTFQFDPNRMFTKAGRISTLKLLNKKYVNAAEETVEEFSDKIISRIRNAQLVVALHNNTNGKPLSAASYKNRYLNPSMDTDDFILTTEKSIYDQLKAKKINTVWETTSTSVDDGSLAYYCSKKNIPYVNVEAQHGHRSQQLKLLNALTSIINNYTK
jgi:hypothetical protein